MPAADSQMTTSFLNAKKVDAGFSILETGCSKLVSRIAYLEALSSIGAGPDLGLEKIASNLDLLHCNTALSLL